MTKNYCVHVYPAMLDYENVKAKSPKEALAKVLAAEWPDESEIYQTEVMIQCDKCGTDNDTDNKKCDDCGAKL